MWLRLVYIWCSFETQAQLNGNRVSQVFLGRALSSKKSNIRVFYIQNVGLVDSSQGRLRADMRKMYEEMYLQSESVGKPK